MTRRRQEMATDLKDLLILQVLFFPEQVKSGDRVCAVIQMGRGYQADYSIQQQIFVWRLNTSNRFTQRARSTRVTRMDADLPRDIQISWQHKCYGDS